jgi:hypothetical protein
MANNWTKGPWRISEHCSGEPHELDIETDSGWFLRISPGYPFNEMAYPDDTQAEFEANAHLIAAAPELYEALKMLVEYIDKEGPAAKEWKAITEWCEKGEQAIAKAEDKT